MQFGFMSGRLQEEYHAKGKKLCMCFVEVEKVFDEVLRKVLEWAMRMKCIPEVLVRSVIGLYEGARTRVRVDSELSKEFYLNVEVHHGSVLSPFLSAMVVDVVTQLAGEGSLGEFLYADDLVLKSEKVDLWINSYNGRRLLRGRV